MDRIIKEYQSINGNQSLYLIKEEYCDTGYGLNNSEENDDFGNIIKEGEIVEVDWHNVNRAEAMKWGFNNLSMEKLTEAFNMTFYDLKDLLFGRL